MIERYTRKQMGMVWQDEYRFNKMLEIEVMACLAQAKLGNIPKAALAQIKKKAKFNLKRVKEIEDITKHDVIAFLTSIAEYVGPASRYIHMGMTSSDILDTALSLQLREAADILIQDVKKLLRVLAKQARRHKFTVMMGRTHSVHAEPITAGLKFALWHEEMKRNLTRIVQAREMINVGKISGAVGTYAHIDPHVEKYVCQKLKLRPASVATQIIQRDRHAQFICALALVGATLEKIATEIRGLQRTEILEMEEFFSKGQKGSSAMPHKRNPITCERICGLARLLRGNAICALENVTLWNERDISHSSAERVILPDSTIALDYMLNKMADIIANLLIYPKNMMININKMRGLIFSQDVMLKLVEKGLSREEAYKIVQRNAMLVWQRQEDYLKLLQEDKDIKKHLSERELKSCFKLTNHTKHVNRIFKQAGL